jgi:hypothetical protein
VIEIMTRQREGVKRKRDNYNTCRLCDIDKSKIGQISTFLSIFISIFISQLTLKNEMSDCTPRKFRVVACLSPLQQHRAPSAVSA